MGWSLGLKREIPINNSIAPVKYINETFGESVYIKNHSFDKKLIEKENPDIVLYEIAERAIVIPSKKAGKSPLTCDRCHP